MPVVLGEPGKALAASALLRDRGFLVPAIRPPTVPEGTARLRASVTAGHDEGSIDRLVAALASAVGEG